MNWKDFIKTHQHSLVLSAGYLLVAALAFGLGRFTSPKINAPQAHVQQATPVPNNYSPNEPAVQSANTATKAVPGTSGNLDCRGLIKGSSSLIYHMPGGSFYNKTTHPIRCFATETEAKAAGFRKSAK